MNVTIYEYLDYQQFLRDFSNALKTEKPWFSYRNLAGKLQIDHSNLIKTILGKRHFSKNNALAFTKFARFNSRETRYFLTLVDFNKARNHTKSKQLLETLFEIKNGVMKKNEPSQHDHFKHWNHAAAIYNLLDYFNFYGDFNALAQELTPPITVHQARESIRLLENLKVVTINSDGRYVQTHQLITTGKKWHSLAIQSFQEETLKLALHSLSQQPKEVRDISTLTMSLSRSSLDDIKEILEQTRKSIVQVIHESSNANTLYQFNLQLFPMTRPKWRVSS